MRFFIFKLEQEANKMQTPVNWEEKMTHILTLILALLAIFVYIAVALFDLVFSNGPWGPAYQASPDDGCTENSPPPKNAIFYDTPPKWVAQNAR